MILIRKTIAQLKVIIPALCCVGLLLNGPITYAEPPFKPYIIESTDDEICEIALAHYDQLFYSSETELSESINSPLVHYPKKFPAEIDFYGQKKLIVADWTTQSGKEHASVYIISPEHRDLFSVRSSQSKKGFKAITEHYFTASYPFLFKDHWYISSRHNRLQAITQPVSIYRLTDSEEKVKVCSIQVYPTTTFEDYANQLPFTYGYRQSLENILLSPSYCTRSYAPSNSKNHGKSFSTMVITRPWILLAPPPMPKTTFGIQQKKDLENQKIKHFSDWKYGEIWSLREHDTYSNFRNDAGRELSAYYETIFNYSKEDVQSLAELAVNGMQNAYYSIGIYYYRDKDFSFLQEILEGRYQNWANLAADLQLPYRETIPLSALSLAIDYPQQLEKLPDGFDLMQIKTVYDKDLLMYAAHMNNYDTVKYFIDQKWPLDRLTTVGPEFSGCDILIQRAKRNALTYAVENASIELIDLLIRAGSDVNILDTEGNNLDYYLQKNPRFNDVEKTKGLKALVERYRESQSPHISCDYPTITANLQTTICSSKGLSIYERELNTSYQQLLANTGSDFQTILQESQEDWVQNRDAECSTFEQPAQIAACIARTTRARTRYQRYLMNALAK